MTNWFNTLNEALEAAICSVIIGTPLAYYFIFVMTP